MRPTTIPIRRPAAAALLAAFVAIFLAGASIAAPAGHWTLVWSDEFDGAAGSPPDAAHWNLELGNAETNGWGNHELQYYTAAPRNAQLDGHGHLVITAEKADQPGPCWSGSPCAYTSARLQTRGKFAFTYGKVEARIKLPAGAGIWPAFWALGTDLPSAGWPGAGELDIMEFVGKTPDTVYGTAHGPGYSGAQGIGKSQVLRGAVADDFHTYTLIKRPHEVIWEVDGLAYHRFTPASLPAGSAWAFEKPMFLLLNLAIGGDWPGPPDAATAFPARMTVDWVRVYRED